MNGKERVNEHERRDWTIILIILLFGFLCVIIAGQWAVRFSPRWKLDTNMQSNLDPDSDFLTNRPVGFYEPLDPSILTLPVWINDFLTPGVTYEPRTPAPVTNTPVPTNTVFFSSPTATLPAITPTAAFPSPTNTLVYYPPPPKTNTPRPPSTNTPVTPPPTNTPITPLPSADLSITKSDGVAFVNSGATVTYTVRVTNNGPSNVTGAILSDPAASGLTKTAVDCSPTPGQCVTPPTIVQLESGFALPVLNNGQFYEIEIRADVTASSGSVTNTSAVAPPSGITDPTPGNNSASDTDTVNMVADLSVTVDDNATSYEAGALKLFPAAPPYAYTITVSNTGPSNVIGATVSNVFTNGNVTSNIGWTCTPSAGASCSAPFGAGNLNNIAVNIDSSAFVTFYLAVEVVLSPSGDLVNEVTVTPPGGIIDPVPGNNTDSDIDTLITADTPPSGIEIGAGPDNDQYDIPAGTALTFSVSLTADGDNNPEFVVYEYNNGGTVYLDWMIVQIGDGSNWYTVFYWGDDARDTNTNLDYNLLAPLTPPEPDERSLPATTPPFYNNSGIAIDIDAIVTPGNYQWLRIIAPIDNNDNQVEIDAIEFLP